MTAENPIRLVVSDVDGTIISRDKTVLPATLAAAERLKAAHIPLALVSSRPPRGMTAVRDALGITGPIGGFNGGVITHGNKVLAEHLIPEDATRQVIDFFRQKSIDIWLFTDTDWIITNAGNEYVAPERAAVAFDPVVVNDLTPYLARCGKIVAVSKDFDFLKSCEDLLNAELQGAANASLSQHYYLDINHPLANKGEALKTFAAFYGVDASDVAALGDMANDIPMLRAAGLGIAMGNATPAVVAAAKAQTGSHDDTGWADAIDRYVLPAKGAAA